MRVSPAGPSRASSSCPASSGNPPGRFPPQRRRRPQRGRAKVNYADALLRRLILLFTAIFDAGGDFTVEQPGPTANPDCAISPIQDKQASSRLRSAHLRHSPTTPTQESGHAAQSQFIMTNDEFITTIVMFLMTNDEVVVRGIACPQRTLSEKVCTVPTVRLARRLRPLEGPKSSGVRCRPIDIPTLLAVCVCVSLQRSRTRRRRAAVSHLSPKEQG